MNEKETKDRCGQTEENKGLGRKMYDRWRRRT